jgi:hypothetical protein
MEKNKFTRTIRKLKSNSINEKLQLLSEIPTNNTTGIYIDEPESSVQDPDIPGDVTRAVDFTQDALANGRDTTGLFDDDGTTILTIEPPGDTSYILGPMASMWYAWGNFSTIGYIRQSDRRMVDLGRITGQLGSWNGSSNFTSYGQLTLEQAVWFRDTPKLNGADNNTPNYRAFYPGPPSNSPDQYGRYLCVITGTPKPTSYTPPPRRIPPTLQGFDPNLPSGLANPFNKLKDLFNSATKDLLKTFGNFFEPLSSLAYAGATFGAFLLQQQGIVNYTKSNPYQTSLPPQDAKAISQALSDVMKTIPRERWENLNGNDLQKINNRLNPGTGPTPSNPDRRVGDYKNVDEYHNIVNNIGRSDAFKGTIKTDPITRKPYVSAINDNYVFTNDADASVKGAPELINFFATSFGAQNRPDMQQSKDIYARTDRMDTSDPDPKKWNAGEEIKLKNMPILVPLPAPSGGTKYNPAGGGMGGKRGTTSESFVVTKNTKKILREIKKPYVLPEEPKVKIKHRPKVIGYDPRVVNSDLMKKAEVPSSFKKAEDRMWGKYERDRNSRMSQERKNEVLDHLGGSDHFWEFMTETSRQKSNDIMYNNFGGKEKKGKIIRKEELKGDTLLFIADENGKKESILQSELSIRIANEFNKKLFEKYFEEQETVQADKDPLFKKVAKRLKKEIDYSDKPAKKGYPNEPPPKMVNGYHPEFGKKKSYYNKLDPQSASAMPETGDPEIDTKIKSAKNQK